MPLYYFNIYDGVDLPDQEGTELPDLDAVRLQAITVAAEVIKDDPKRVSLGQNWRLEVTDDRGQILFRLDFSIMESAAVPRPRPEESS